ncbi:hypothetical protein FRB98_008803, partial [Tulasnella sp. 332]
NALGFVAPAKKEIKLERREKEKGEMAEAAAAEDEGETGEKGTGGKRVNKSSNTIAINKDDRANSGNDDDGAEDYGPEAEHSSLVQAVRHAMSYTPLPIDQQTSVSGEVQRSALHTTAHLHQQEHGHLARVVASVCAYESELLYKRYLQSPE